MNLNEFEATSEGGGFKMVQMYVHPGPLTKWSNFDVRIFFRWVEGWNHQLASYGGENSAIEVMAGEAFDLGTGCPENEIFLGDVDP